MTGRLCRSKYRRTPFSRCTRATISCMSAAWSRMSMLRSGSSRKLPLPIRVRCTPAMAMSGCFVADLDAEALERFLEAVGQAGAGGHAVQVDVQADQCAGDLGM